MFAEILFLHKMIKMLLMASLIKFGFKCASVKDIFHIRTGSGFFFKAAFYEFLF